ncbi:hypothetical protein LDO26_12635 [Luteimonas sp. BDR2-5]|uniref:hypothetical protein n=1 Tax=Proluteimonas luteida TaxID=2878685 RepID=UPI001E630539|nr:hypothetical protein [Luteimonas sp. BDR2-5]MCD9029047.1 hypothetical protein [Luteimonas sp. BDR2-5]
MTRNISFQDQELLRIIGEVLHYIWDPIGVTGVPQARDEYYGYVRPVFTLLRSRASDADLSAYLEQIVINSMGLPSHKERSDEAASVLTSWRDYQARVVA